MFTRIIESIGIIKSMDKEGEDLKVNVTLSDKKLKDINIGDSISVNGICLTAVSYTHLTLPTTPYV